MSIGKRLSTGPLITAYLNNYWRLNVEKICHSSVEGYEVDEASTAGGGTPVVLMKAVCA